MSAMKETISSLWTYGCSLWILLTLHCTNISFILESLLLFVKHFFIPNFFLIEQGIVFNSFIFVWFILV